MPGSFSSSEPPPGGPLRGAPANGDAGPKADGGAVRHSHQSLPQPAPALDRCELDGRISRLVRLQAGRQDALIELLHAVQQLRGHLSPAALRQVALELQLPLSRVYGVASFYHLFQLQSPAAHRCGVCLGTACFVRGGGPLLERLSRLMGLAPDQPGGDGTWQLERLSCLGACGQAPLLLIDDQVVAELPLADPVALDRRLRQALADAEGLRAKPAGGGADGDGLEAAARGSTQAS